MSSSLDFLTRLNELGITVTLDGDELLLKAPKGAVTSQLRAELLARKTELILLLRSAHLQDTLPLSSAYQSDSLLSHAQLRIWFLTQLQGDNSVWNVASILHIHGVLNEKALSRTFSEIVTRHHVLQSVFRSINGVPHASTLPVSSWSMEVQSFPSTAAARAAAHASALQRFDLAAGPLFRATLCTVAEGEQFLAIAAHHIVCDGWSLGVLATELSTLYQAFATQAGSPLPPLSHQYSDYVAWERAIPPKALSEELKWWKAQLSAPLPVLQLFPTSAHHPATVGGRRSTSHLSASTFAQLRELARSREVTMFTLLLAAFKVLLFRFTGSEDVVVGTVSSYRKRREFEAVIGMFANPVVLRTSFSGEPNIAEVLDRVRTTVTSSFARDTVPFDQIVEHLRPDRDPAHPPLFQVSFAYQNLPIPELDWNGTRISIEAPDILGARYDLSIEVWETPGGLTLDWEFNTALYDEATIQRLQQSYGQLLYSLLATPDSSIATIDLLTPLEKQELELFGHGELSPYSLQTIDALFEEIRNERPDAIALIEGDANSTYDQLGSASDRIAQHLLFAGVERGEAVALLMHRSISSIQAMLGVLKAGASYIPLSLSYPETRLLDTLTRAGARYILVDTPPAWLQTRPEFICIEVAQAAPARPQTSTTQHHPHVSIDSVMCVLYTSGSKGVPKGVEITHRGLVRLLFSKELGSFGQQTTVLHIAPQNFDASLLEIWGALVHGGTVVVDPEPRPDLNRINHLLKSHKIGAAWFTSSLFNWIISEAPYSLLPLHTIFIGGEVLSAKHVRQAQQTLPALEMINGYGPTEATVFTCLYPIPRNLPEGLNSIPIGKPLSNTDVFVLDAHLQLVPVGVTGELCIGGDALARGYRNDPALTAEKFILNPVTGKGLVYRSGDLVSWLPDGNLHFVGRADDQVKVRGHRIELSEIEAALSSQRDIVSAAAMLDTSQANGDRIIAWYSAARPVSPQDVLAALKTVLPPYMLPSLLLPLDTMPLLQSGKIDRAALALAPRESPTPCPATELLPPDDLVYLVAQAMADVLHLPSVEAADDFFDLGGHSLLALQFSSRLESLLGRRISAALLFQASTPASIALLLEDQHAFRPQGLVPLRPTGSLPAIFCVHLLTDGRIQQYLSLVRALDPAVPVYALCPVEFDPRHDQVLSVQQMASAHIEQMKHAVPSGSYRLCGYSSGGILAFEIARQLHDQGDDVTLILIDSFPPGTLRRMASHDSWKILRLFFHPYSRGRMKDRAIKRAGRIYSRSRSALRSLTSAKAPAEPSLEEQLEAALGTAMRRYVPSPYLGPAVLFRSEDTVAINLFNFDGYNNWGRFIPNGITLSSVPGDHLQIMKPPFVAALAQKLVDVCQSQPEIPKEKS